MATSMTLPNIMSKFTVEKTFEGAWENSGNERAAFAALQKLGHADYNVEGGKELLWSVKGGRHSINPYGIGDTVSIAQQDLAFNARLPWAMYNMVDGITSDEIAIMRGNGPAFYRRQEKLVSGMCDDFLSRLNSEFLNSDGGTGSTNVLHGLETFFAVSASSSNTKTGTVSDTYAGNSTALSGITGLAAVEADAWTPTVVNKGKSGTAAAVLWTAAGGFNIANAIEIFDFGVVQGMKGGKSNKMRGKVGHFNRVDFPILRGAVIAQQRGLIEGQPNGTLGLGIPGALYLSGVEVVLEHDIESASATPTSDYLLNYNDIYLEVIPAIDIANLPSMAEISSGKKNKMFEATTGFEVAQNALTVRVNFRAQLRFNPRTQVKFDDLA